MTPKILIPKRAAFLAAIRQFFADRNVYEVDTALLTYYGVTDTNLTSLTADTGYLITSPEYAMKMLLCNGAPDIYQLSHVFRGEEQGRKHRREFMLLEWYRLGWDINALMDEVANLITHLLSSRNLPIVRTAYNELFLNFLNIDLFTIDDAALATLCTNHIPESTHWQLGRDGMIDLLFTHFIEPHLGKNCLQFVTDYLPSQAALARLSKDVNGNLVAARFEAYIDGIELCNGFHELADADEQRERFKNDNLERAANNLPIMPLDEPFLCALAKGLPDCSGVALGVDRLFMLAMNAQDINDISY